MNREELQRLASEWTRIAKNDIRNKVISFMEKVCTDESELAYALALSNGELKQILEGDGEITLSTFAKLLIATGHALEIRPIEETPIARYDNFPSEDEPNCRAYNPPSFNDSMSCTRQEEFARAMAEKACRRQAHRPTQPRDEHGRFMSTRTKVEKKTSPFESMTVDELVKIIKERLWDFEIDLNRASKEELVDFLNGKNKRMEEMRRMKELEEDPKVIEFKNKLKETLNNNPHLREWTKNFLN